MLGRGALLTRALLQLVVIGRIYEWNFLVILAGLAQIRSVLCVLLNVVVLVSIRLRSKGEI